MSKPITLKHQLAAPFTAPAGSHSTKQNAIETDQAEVGHEKASTPAKGLLTRIGVAIKKVAEVADGIDKIRNAIEGVYKLAGAVWPLFLLLWPK